MAVALALATVVARPALGKPAGAKKAGSLAGQLLVAKPAMADPRFSRTVVYVVRHDETGAFGLVVNRPFKELPIESLLRRLELDYAGVSGSLRMHYGGPVQPGSVFVLHTADYRGEGTEVLANGIALTGSPDILRAIGTGAGPRRALLALSYSGWAPGQLEREFKAGGWVAVPADVALIFDDDCDTKWDRAMARAPREFDL
jgi:putative transcriptional regulator